MTKDLTTEIRPIISAVVITYNEEKHIRMCLESLSWVGEIIVVDSESNDQTLDIAKEFTEKVFVRPWPGFSAQRNYGISKAKGQWILILDADECVPNEARHEITTWLTTLDVNRYKAVLVPRRNFFFGKWTRNGGAYPDLQYRLFRNGKIRYDENSLDTPLVSGPSKRLEHPFDHFTGDTVADRVRKIGRETTYKARMLQAKKSSVSWMDIFFRPMVTFIKFYILKQGFRDGLEGYLYSTLACAHTFLRYAKCFEFISQASSKDLSRNNMNNLAPRFGPNLDGTIEKKPRHSLAMLRFFRLRRVQRWTEDRMRDGYVIS